MPSDFEYLNLINAVSSNGQPPSDMLNRDWSLLFQGATGNNTGFQADAYYNPMSNDIVLAFYGPSITPFNGAWASDSTIAADRRVRPARPRPLLRGRVMPRSALARLGPVIHVLCAGDWLLEVAWMPGSSPGKANSGGDGTTSLKTESTRLAQIGASVGQTRDQERYL